jgi:sensor histidine kinase YesM
MYEIFQLIHKALFFVVMILGLAVLVRAAMGLSSKSEFTESDRKMGLFFLISNHTQLLIGLILYLFLSPLALEAIKNLGMAEVMKNPVYRQIAVEHISTNIIAIILITIGYSKNKRAIDSAVRHKNALIFYGLGLVLLLSRIPWDKLF